MKFITSGCGGTGRRASLRSWRAQVRAGSNPAAPTIADLSHPHGWLFRISEARPDHRGAHRRAREGDRRPKGGVRARGAGRLGREGGGSGVYLHTDIYEVSLTAQLSGTIVYVQNGPVAQRWSRGLIILWFSVRIRVGPP